MSIDVADPLAHELMHFDEVPHFPLQAHLRRRKRLKISQGLFSLRKIAAGQFTNDQRVRGCLAVVEGNASLTLFDMNGKRRISLAAHKERPELAFLSKQGQQEILLGYIGLRPGMSLLDENGKHRFYLTLLDEGPMFSLRDENNMARVGVSVLRDGPHMVVMNAKGHSTWFAP